MFINKKIGTDGWGTIFSLFVWVVLATSGSASARTPVASMEGLSEYRLDNGLKIILFPDPSASTITVNITYLVGSAHENYGETGMAHLLEHLLFKGTPSHPNVPDVLNAHGAQWNGTTWTDRTNYFETMPATDENLAFAISFEADRMVNSFIRQSDLDTEMTVVRNEFEISENNPIAILEERTLSSAYLFHNYGHSTIGARSDIEDVPIERLKAFYKQWYQPDNAVLIVAGAFDRERALSLIEDSFGTIEKPSRTLPAFYTVEPPQDGERHTVLRRVGEVGAVTALYHIPSATHPDTAALEILARLLAEAPYGRLYKALVPTGKAVSVWQTHYKWKDPSVLLFSARVAKTDTLEEVLNDLIHGVEDFASHPAGEADVERARNALLNDYEQALGDSEWMAITLSDWAATGDWRSFFVHLDRLEKVGAADVNRVGAYYLRRANRTSGIYVPTDAPERVEIPRAEDSASIAAALKRSDGDTEKDLEAVQVDPEVLEAHTRRFVVPEGASIALLPRQTRRDRVRLHLLVGIGDEKLPAEEGGDLNPAVAALLMRGCGEWSRDAFEGKLDALRAQLRVTGTKTSTEIQLETNRTHILEALELVRSMLEAPLFDEGEVAQYRRSTSARLEEGQKEPRDVTWRGLFHHFYPKGHPLYVETFEEAIERVKAITPERLRRFHQAHYGLRRSAWAVVGDFDDTRVEEKIRSIVSAFKGHDAPRWATPRAVKRPEALHKVIHTPDKSNAVIMVGTTLKLRRSEPDDYALRAAVYLIGGEALNSRLARRLRQKEGVSYATWSRLITQTHGNAAAFIAGAATAPENAERAEKMLLEEMRRAYQEGFSEDEVHAACERLLERWRVRLSRPEALSRWMAQEAARNHDFSELARMMDAFQTMTAKKVNRAVRRSLRPGRLSVWRAGDFERTSAAR